MLAVGSLGVVVALYQAITFVTIFEGKFRPVVKSFDVEALDVSNGVAEFSGSMDKVRPCDFNGVVAYVSYDNEIRQVRNVVFSETKVYVTRAQGKQSFGSWFVNVGDYTMLNLISRHTCDGKQVFTDLTSISLRVNDEH